MTGRSEMKGGPQRTQCGKVSVGGQCADECVGECVRLRSKGKEICI